MRSLILLVLLSSQAQAPAALESQIRSLIAASGAEVAVAYHTLDGRSEVLIDPDKPFHAASTMTVRALNEAMITVSSNFATNLMIERLDVKKIRATVTTLGADGMKVLRGV